MKFNIYVGNLSHSVTEEALKAAFEAYGTVTSAKIIKDRFTGEHRGFGFVEMASDEEGRRACQELNGKDLEGRPLRVDESRPREGGNARPSFGARRPSFGDRNGGGSTGGDRGGSRGPRRF